MIVLKTFSLKETDKCLRNTEINPTQRFFLEKVVFQVLDICDVFRTNSAPRSFNKNLLFISQRYEA